MAQDRFVTASDATTLHLLDWGGNGPTAYFLHGTSACAGSWEPIVKRLNGCVHAIGIDLRGHGDSGHSAGPVGWDLLIGDFLSIVQAEDPRGAILIAHSRGAGVGLLASSRVQDRFAGAYVIEPSILWRIRSTAASQFDAQQLERTRRRRAVFPSRKAAFDRFRDRGPFKDAADETLWAFVGYGLKDLPDGQVALKCDPEVEALYYNADIAPDEVWAAASRIEFPVKLVYNSESGRPADAPEVNKWASLCPTEVAVMPGTHFGAWEHPDTHAKGILEFVSHLSNSRPARHL